MSEELAILCGGCRSVLGAVLNVWLAQVITLLFL